MKMTTEYFNWVKTNLVNRVWRCMLVICMFVVGRRGLRPDQIHTDSHQILWKY